MTAFKVLCLLLRNRMETSQRQLKKGACSERGKESLLRRGKASQQAREKGVKVAETTCVFLEKSVWTLTSGNLCSHVLGLYLYKQPSKWVVLTLDDSLPRPAWA